MITLRNSVAAFLRREKKILLMRRADDRVYLPGLWSGVGGHMEPSEINDPSAACYREIEEETGIAKESIASLALLYIITRRSGDEIRQNYVYFGECACAKLRQTDEGTLCWIPESELLERTYSHTFTEMLCHYTQRRADDRSLYVGVAEDGGGRLRMKWARCEDFE